MPQHLSLATFHDTAVSACGIPVAQAYLNQAEIASEAVRMLMRKIDEPGCEAYSIRVPYREIRDGATLAPPPPSK